MERNLQTHESRYAANESSAVGCFGIPEWRGRLKMLDIRENLLRVRLTQINTVTCSQVLDVQVTVACPRLSGHPHKMSQHVSQFIAFWMQAGNLDLLFARLAEPNKRMAITGCGTGTKIDVIGSFGCSTRLRLSDRFGVCCRQRDVRCSNSRCHISPRWRLLRTGSLLQVLLIGLHRKLLRAAATNSQTLRCR